jgi:putative ABC transport system ATP-binding protein
VTAQPAAAVSSVSRRFGEGATAVTAVRSATLRVYPGEVVSVMGPSGSGKSTLLCLIGGLLEPDDGDVEIGGRALRDLPRAEQARLRRAHMGFIFQKFNLLKGLSALENVELGLRLAGATSGEARARAARALEQIGLSPCASRLPRDLSGGEQQRVAVARALAPEPDLVLADEPTGNLDSTNGRAVIDLLCAHAHRAGAAVVVVTHDHRVRDVVDRRLWMEDGVLRGDEHAEAGSLRAGPV